MIIDQLRGANGVKIGHQAVDRIGEFQLTATPQNYEVWLHYVTGSTPDLTKIAQRVDRQRRKVDRCQDGGAT